MVAAVCAAVVSPMGQYILSVDVVVFPRADILNLGSTLIIPLLHPINEVSLCHHSFCHIHFETLSRARHAVRLIHSLT